MINEIINTIEEYQKESQLLSKKYKNIVDMFDCNFESLEEYLKGLSLEESEVFVKNYKNFMSTSCVEKLNIIIDSKKTTARYFPILNKLLEFGFSQKKIIKLDEFLYKYIKHSIVPGKKTILELNANGFNSILTSKDKKNLYKFLIENKIALPIFTYYCSVCEEETQFKKSDIDNMEKFLQYQSQDDGNQSEDFYKEYEKLENDILYCHYCGNNINLNIADIIKNYNFLLKCYNYCSCIELLDNPYIRI